MRTMIATKAIAPNLWLLVEAQPADVKPTFSWDEPKGATTPRGWLFSNKLNSCVANYLDYGSDHYRSPHEYCQPNRPCKDCQPGNIHVTVYRLGAHVTSFGSRYCETISEARAWAENLAGEQSLI